MLTNTAVCDRNAPSSILVFDRDGTPSQPTEPQALACANSRHLGPHALCIGLMMTATLVGCVRRTVTITPTPPGARVFLHDQELGRSEVTTDFLWYGDYGVTLRKKGYETLKTHWEIRPPWYQYMPIDFLSEVLWPGHIHDARSAHFELQPRELPSSEELVERAIQTRDRALDRRK